MTHPGTGEKSATGATREDDSSALSLRSSDFLTRLAFRASLAGYESVGEEDLFALQSSRLAKCFKRGGFFLGQPIFFFTQRGGDGTNGDKRLHFTSPLCQTLIVGRDSHRSADERAMAVDGAASVRLERRAGDVVELLHESIHFCISPVVKKNGVPERRSRRLHGGDLCLGSLLDQATGFRIHAGQAVLEDLRVEDRNREGADAAAGTAEPAGELA